MVRMPMNKFCKNMIICIYERLLTIINSLQYLAVFGTS